MTCFLFLIWKKKSVLTPLTLNTIIHLVSLNRLQHAFGSHNTAYHGSSPVMYDRFQTVPVNSNRSDPVKLPRGVPRGSVLGPVLFTLYTIPLASNIYRHNLNHRFYASNSDQLNSTLLGTIFQDEASITVLNATKAMNRRNRQTKKKRTAIVRRTAMVSSPHLQHRNSEHL